MSGLAGLRARVLLTEARALGIELADLQAVSDHQRPVTLAEVIEEMSPVFTSATATTYRPYWRLAIALHGDTPIGSLTVGDLQQIVDLAGDRARQRRPGSAGHASRETTVAALRAVFRRAAASGLIVINPAASLTKARRPTSRRRALTDREVIQVVDAVAASSRDPELDLMLIRFHLETGARRQGALGLRVADLDDQRSTVWLHEKNDTHREQPVAPTLLQRLLRLSRSRGGVSPADRVFRTLGGVPISARHYDTLFTSVRRSLPWTARTPVSAHVLRHTAVTAVGRIGGYPVAQAFAGHVAPTVTGRYLHASVTEVAAAVEVMTGEPHPLAPEAHGGPRCRRR